MPDGDYLTLSVWPGKKDPTAEVLTIQIRRMEGDEWMTAGRLAVYRTQDGTYSQLPERPAQINSEKTKMKEQEEKEL